MSKPNFLHDCEGCIFLGPYEWKLHHEYGKPSMFDLYTCKQGVNWPTVLARYSSDGPDYLSGLETAIQLEAVPLTDADRTHPLVEAMRRAKEHGHLTKKETATG